MNADIYNIRFTGPDTGSCGGPGAPGWPDDHDDRHSEDPGQKKKKHTARTVMIIAAVLIVILMIAGSLAAALLISGDSTGPYVGVLYVQGEIRSSSAENDTYQQGWLIEQIDSMMDDDLNKGLLLYVDSPGGGVSPSDDLYQKIMEYKENTDRPLYAYFDDTAASGAYYISACADKITAKRTCTTGSIGVYIGPVINAGGLLQKLGIGVDIIRSAENKAMGNSYEPLTDEQRAIYQAYVDEYYDRFVSIVAQGRGMTEARVREIADGRIYTASQALENGLIDEISTFEEAKEKMLEETDLEKCDLVDYRYIPKNSIYTLLGEAKSESISEMDLAAHILNGDIKPELMYKMS